MTTILVTGGCGFVGSHTCLLLLENGYELVVLDSCVNSSPISIQRVIDLVKKNDPKVNQKINFIKGDVRDKKLLEEIFLEAKQNSNRIEGVIHFAGLKSVEDSITFPLRYWDVNIQGVLNLLIAMEKYDCSTIVFSSSATIYACQELRLIKEDDKIDPVNPYGQTKATVEKILADLFHSYPDKWRIANLRYFNPIGAHPSGLIGEDPFGKPSNLFPFLTQVASKQRYELLIFGNDWPTKDGTGVRDYIHIMDLAEGHLLALNYLLYEVPQMININLGTGKGTSVLELLETFEKVTNIRIPYSFSQRRPGDIALSIANNTLAKNILGWQPKKTLSDMCLDGWNWRKLNPNGYVR